VVGGGGGIGGFFSNAGILNPGKPIKQPGSGVALTKRLKPP
jgi:hypothetical protein